jgi:membrane-associated protease RseP (regulator of RpoE activity)
LISRKLETTSKKGTWKMNLNWTPEFAFLFWLVIFWAALYVLAHVFHLDKRGLEVNFAYLMYKSPSLNSFIDKVAKKKPIVWTVLSYIGLAVGLGLMAYALYFFINNLLLVFTQAGEAAQVAPLIPGLTLSLYWLPYIVFAAVVIVLPHELAHGIIARLEKIPVLSTGIFVLLVFFGAFVEPDEKEFEKARLLARLRVLSAGSSTNLVTALLTMMLLSGLFAPVAGILIHETVPDGPANTVGLGRWDVIQAINGTSITLDNFSGLMSSVKPGENLTLTVLRNNQVQNVTITTVAASENASRAILGLIRWSGYQPNILRLDQYTGINLYWTIFWTYFVAINIAIVNMFPMFPFDGEKVVYYVLERPVKKHKRELRIVINGFTLGILALSFLFSYLQYGLFSL